jgi:hypothetical protein
MPNSGPSDGARGNWVIVGRSISARDSAGRERPPVRHPRAGSQSQLLVNMMRAAYGESRTNLVITVPWAVRRRAKYTPAAQSVPGERLPSQ